MRATSGRALLIPTSLEPAERSGCWQGLASARMNFSTSLQQYLGAVSVPGAHSIANGRAMAV